MNSFLILDFMECYYGPLLANHKKIHTSLVGCLRNERHLKRKGEQSLGLSDDVDKSFTYNNETTSRSS